MTQPTSLSVADLVVTDLDVQRGELVLCRGVSFSLNAGDICHVVGNNGTGKTSLLMQLAGLLPIVTGQVQYITQPVYISHQVSINTDLTIIQNLRFLLALYGVTTSDAHIKDALTWVNLQGLETLTCSQLSAGQARRVNLARLFVMSAQHSKVWLLDEPFTALDGFMINKLQQRMQAFVDEDGMILMTSHQSTKVANQKLDLSLYLT